MSSKCESMYVTFYIKRLMPETDEQNDLKMKGWMESKLILASDSAFPSIYPFLLLLNVYVQAA